MKDFNCITQNAALFVDIHFFLKYNITLFVDKNEKLAINNGGGGRLAAVKVGR